MKRMCWFYKGMEDDDRLYVETDEGFVPYDELPIDLLFSDGRLNHMLGCMSNGELSVSPGYTAMLMLRDLHGYKLVNGRNL